MRSSSALALRTGRTRDRFEDDRAHDRALILAGWRAARITDTALERAPHGRAGLRLLLEP